MLVEGYDYPPDDRYIECERCHGTGTIWFIARSDGNGDVDMGTYHEVDKDTYDRAADIDDAPKGTWVQCDDLRCPDCEGEGWIDQQEAEEIARELDAEAREEERRIERYLATLA